MLYAKEKILRTDVKKQLSDRARYRRNRRNRLRYRKPRFDNRVKTKCSRCGINNVPKAWGKKKRKNGKSRKTVSNGRAALCRQCQGKKGMHNKPHILAPSVRNRADSILNDVDKLAKGLPISRVVVETASFDTQKMANIDIKGVEYQQGTLFGEEVKQYLLTVYGHKCAYCGGMSRDPVLEIDHIRPQSKGGSDKVSNLTISCVTCNHDKSSMTLEQWERVLQARPSDLNERRLKRLPNIKKQRELKKGFQYSALTQSYKNYLLDELRKRFSITTTYGAKTKYDRKRLELAKTQINDAMVIASEGQPFEMPDIYIAEKQIKKRRPAQYISPCKAGVRITKKKLEREKFGYRLWDKVLYCDPELGDITGRLTTIRSSGSCRVGSVDTTNLLAQLLDKSDPSVSYRKLELLEPQYSNYVREKIAIEPA